MFDDAVGGDLLAWPHHEPIADYQLVDGNACLQVIAQHGHVFRAELEQRLECRARPTFGACFEVTAREDEHRDPGCDLEVDL